MDLVKVNRILIQQIIEDLLSPRKTKQPTIGIEYERVTVLRKDLSQKVIVDNDDYEKISEALMKFSSPGQTWVPYEDCGFLKGIKDTQNGHFVTMEPGLQMEIASGVYTDLNRCLKDMAEINAHLLPHLKKYGVRLLPEALNPSTPPQETYVSPYRRFDFLVKALDEYSEYRQSGQLWLRYMMSLSAGMQFNFDHYDAEDMMRKMKAMFLLQPVLVAVFGNSPFIYGKYTQYLSYRYVIWHNIDRHFLNAQKFGRCGMWSMFWQKRPTVEEYVNHAIQVPMLFLWNDKNWIKVPRGYTFADLLHGKAIEGKVYEPTLPDWRNHNSTIFSDVRPRSGYTEIRFLDTNRWDILEAAAVWLFNMFYDDDILNFVLSWTQDYGMCQENYDEIMDQVVRFGLSATMPNKLTMQDVAQELYDMVMPKLCNAKDLQSRLEVVGGIIASGCNPAQSKVQKFDQDWSRFVQSLSE